MARPDTLTVAGAAARLGVSDYTIRREIREGNLRTLPFAGRIVRIPVAAIDEWLASAEKAAS